MEDKKLKAFGKDIQKHLLSGVSFMIPLVVAGGVIYAISILGAVSTAKGLVPNGPIMTYLSVLGKAGLSLMIPVFAGYIAYSVAGRPGLAPGFIMGFIANNTVQVNGIDVKSGFLGALLLGLIVGYIAKWMKSWKVSKTVKTIMPILIIPTLTTLIAGALYYCVIAIPCSWIMNALTETMNNLEGASKYALATGIGIFGELDYGGPVTKAVSMFTLSLINEGNYFPNGLFRIIVAVPPIGIFFSTLIAKSKWSIEDRDLAKSIAIIGCGKRFKEGSSKLNFWLCCWSSYWCIWGSFMSRTSWWFYCITCCWRTTLVLCRYNWWGTCNRNLTFYFKKAA